MKKLAAVRTVVLAIGTIFEQNRPPSPAYSYEVVSIHPGEAGSKGTGIGPGPQAGVRTQNTSAMDLLVFAGTYPNTGSWVSRLGYRPSTSI